MKAPSEEAEIFSRNKNFYEAMTEFIDSEIVFLTQIRELIVLCDYKSKTMRVFAKVKGGEEVLKKNQAFQDLEELKAILEILNKLISPVKVLDRLSEGLSSSSEKKDNNYFTIANKALISAFKEYFTTETINFIFSVFSPYVVYYEKYVSRIESLFKDEKAEILYLLGEKYIEKVTILNCSYILEGSQVRQGDAYNKLLGPILTSALISIVQRGPRYKLLLTEIAKHSLPEIKEYMDNLKKACEINLYIMNANKSIKTFEKTTQVKDTKTEGQSPKPPPPPARFLQRRLSYRTEVKQSALKPEPKPVSEQKQKQKLKSFPIVRKSQSLPPSLFGLFGRKLKSIQSEPRGLPLKPPPKPKTFKGHVIELPTIKEEKPRDFLYGLFPIKLSKSAPPVYSSNGQALSGPEAFSKSASISTSSTS